MNDNFAQKYLNLFLFINIRVIVLKASDGFEKTTDNFELTLDTLAESNSHLIAVLGDFNIKSKNWYVNDKTTTKGEKIEFATSQYGLHQIINEATHVLENSLFCVDLIFTSQPNLVVDSGFSGFIHLYSQTAIIK